MSMVLSLQRERVGVSPKSDGSDFPHDHLTSMTFRIYMTLHMTNGYLGLPCYIALIDSMAHSRDVDDMTHENTRHDSAGTFVLLLVCMSSCSVAG